MIIDYLERIEIDISELKSKEDDIKKIVDIIKNSKNIYICGNGGSSSTASHLSQDLQKMCKLKSFCLTDSTPLITAWSNDVNYEVIFMKQLETLANKDDCLIILSGSGNSPNLFNAAAYANAIGMNTIAIVGMNGGRLLNNIDLDVCLHIKTDMQHAEDCHMILSHIILMELYNG